MQAITGLYVSIAYSGLATDLDIRSKCQA